MPELGCTPDVVSYSILLKGFCNDNRAEEALELLQRMPELGCTPDVVSYNILLKGFCNENRAEEALELLHMMANDRGRSCPPNVVSYSTVINGFFTEGQVDKAYDLFLEMMDQGIPPNVVTYTPARQLFKASPSLLRLSAASLMMTPFAMLVSLGAMSAYPLLVPCREHLIISI